MSEIQAGSTGSEGGPGEAGGSSFGQSMTRLAEVFYAPVAMFRGMAKRWGWSDWLVPILVLALASGASAHFLKSHFDLDAAAAQAREQLEAQGGLSEEQIDRFAEGQVKFMTGPFLPVMAALSWPVIILVVGLIVWGAVSAFGGRLTFGRSLSITGYSSLPRVLEGLLLLFVLQGREPVRPDLLPRVLATNPSSWLDAEAAGTGLYALAQSFNPFALWTVALMGLGVSAVGGLSRKSGLVLMGALYGVWVILAVAGAAIF